MEEETKERRNILLDPKTSTKCKWGIYIESEIMEKIKNDAKEQDRSINYIIEKILEAHYGR